MLASGKVTSCLFPAEAVSRLKTDIIVERETDGLKLHRSQDDRTDVLVDSRFLQLDPEVALGEFSLGVRVGPCRASQHCTRSKKRGLPQQADPLHDHDQHRDSKTTWRQTYWSVHDLVDKVFDVLRSAAPTGTYSSLRLAPPVLGRGGLRGVHQHCGHIRVCFGVL